MDLRVDRMQVVKHEHLAVILAHGDVSVFGLNEVEADYIWIAGGDLKREKCLCEDLLRRGMLAEPGTARGSGLSRPGQRWAQRSARS